MGFSLKTVLLRLVQGFIIGAGGILPGISGGVLSVIFGIYRPVMEVLAHPLNGLRRHLSLLLPVGAGAILGFLCGGGLILVRPAFLPSPPFCSTRSTARSTRCARASSAFSSAACFGA